MGFNTVLSPSLTPAVARRKKRNTSAKNNLDRIGSNARKFCVLPP
jgi:hypothetical protein